MSKTSTYKLYEESIKDNNILIADAVSGVDASVFFDAAKVSGKRNEELASYLNVSLKTLMRYRKTKRKLDPLNSEQILKLIALYRDGEEVFGSIDSFNNWLEKPSVAFNNNCPSLFMKTSGGIDLIREEISRIAFGDFA